MVRVRSSKGCSALASGVGGGPNASCDADEWRRGSTGVLVQWIGSSCVHAQKDAFWEVAPATILPLALVPFAAPPNETEVQRLHLQPGQYQPCRPDVVSLPVAWTGLLGLWAGGQ
jgi:hypothetical protein